jgi:hypothetical protein
MTARVSLLEGTVLSSDRTVAETSEDAPTSTDSSVRRKAEIGATEPFRPANDESGATEPSQAARTVPSQLVNRVGGGTAGSTMPTPLNTQNGTAVMNGNGNVAVFNNNACSISRSSTPL